MRRPHIFEVHVNTPLTQDQKRRLYCTCDGRVHMEIVDAILDIAREYNKLEGLLGRVYPGMEGTQWEVRKARGQVELRATFPVSGARIEEKKFSHSLEKKGRVRKIRVTRSIVAPGWSWDAKARMLTHSSGKTELVP